MAGTRQAGKGKRGRGSSGNSDRTQAILGAIGGAAVGLVIVVIGLWMFFGQEDSPATGENVAASTPNDESQPAGSAGDESAGGRSAAAAPAAAKPSATVSGGAASPRAAFDVFKVGMTSGDIASASVVFAPETRRLAAAHLLADVRQHATDNPDERAAYEALLEAHGLSAAEFDKVKGGFDPRKAREIAASTAKAADSQRLIADAMKWLDERPDAPKSYRRKPGEKPPTLVGLEEKGEWATGAMREADGGGPGDDQPIVFQKIGDRWFVDMIASMEAQDGIAPGTPPVVDSEYPDEPGNAAPLPPQKKVELKLGTPEEAFATLHEATLHRDWETMFKATEPQVRGELLDIAFRQVLETGPITPAPPFAAKHGLDWERVTESFSLRVMDQNIEDPSLLYADMLEWADSQDMAEWKFPAMKGREHLGIRFERATIEGNTATIYATSDEFDDETWRRRLFVFQRVDGNWLHFPSISQHETIEFADANLPIPPDLAAPIKAASAVWDLKVSPDGKTVVVSDGIPKEIVAIDLATGEEKWKIREAAGTPNDLAYSHDGQSVAAIVSPDYERFQIKVYDAATGKERSATPLVEGSGTMQVAFSPDDETLVHHSNDQKINLYDAVSGRQREAVSLGRGWSSLELSDDGNTIASETSRFALVQSIEPFRELHQFREWSEHLWLQELSADGRFIALKYSRPEDRSSVIVVRDLKTGAKLGRFRTEGHPEVFSPDGRYVVGQIPTNRVGVWRVADGLRVAAWYGHTANIIALGVTPDNKVVSGDNDGFVRVWTIPEGE